MTKKKTATPAPKPPTEPATVIGAKRIRKTYSLGDDYQAWKEHCDDLKVQSAFHSSEATRYRNAYKKAYENGAKGFCTDRDTKEWEKANNLITIAALKESERANAWKTLPIDKLDIPCQLLGALEEAKFDSLGKLAEWANRENREKIKGVSDKSVEKIRSALNAVIAPYHEPLISAHVEEAKVVIAKLNSK
ncbi:MAG: hypothetical protein FWD31_04670 [Planctomycetaceae bacterium]|nr:hypothetical protein [Planctomycetaceae bacterium]